MQSNTPLEMVVESGPARPPGQSWRSLQGMPLSSFSGPGHPRLDERLLLLLRSRVEQLACDAADWHQLLLLQKAVAAGWDHR